MRHPRTATNDAGGQLTRRRLFASRNKDPRFAIPSSTTNHPSAASRSLNELPLRCNSPRPCSNTARANASPSLESTVSKE